MDAKRSLRLIPIAASALLALGSPALLALGCAGEHVRVAAPRTLAATDAGAAAPSLAPATTPPRLPHAARAAFAVRRPEIGITTPMAGEPVGAAAAESRLVPSSCEQASAEEIEPVLRAMRASVDRSFKDWHDGQPECWAQMREEYRWRKEMEALSAGGAGLTGYGMGGGGRGEGIGLGAIGTVGHGAATQVRVANPPRLATRASGTNNQVAGVEEADLVKTDGRFVYFAAGGALRIMEALDPKVVSVTNLRGTARELFVEGDRAVVYTSLGSVGRACKYGYDCTFSGDGTRTTVSVFDLTDRAAPRLTRSFELSGSLMAARRIGHAIHTVVADGDAPDAPPYVSWPVGLDKCGTPEPVVRAQLARLKAENEASLRRSSSTRGGFPTLSEDGKSRILCNNLLRTALRDGKAFTTVVSFDLTDDKTAPATATLQSRPGAVFASESGLYVSVTHRKGAGTGRWYSSPSYSAADEVSEIHKFQIGDKPKDTRYVGSGTVPGHVLSQFSMDEWYGYLRVATTKGKVPDPRVESVISILAEQPGGRLARIGAIDKIAPGEDIRAVRFDDDRGYVVTFKKTDPLFVLDLFEPRKPAILGELKIPGFSTYIHRVDPEHLLSIGFDADDHGGFAYFNGVILQLFDVKNPTDPRLLHKEKIGTRGSSSEAATDHLAFNYLANDGLLAVPMTICDGGGEGRAGTLSFSGLLVYDVDLDRGFTRLGGVDHGTQGVSCDTWWSNANSAVKRSVFLDDLVYSITNERVKVQRMARFGVDVANLPLVSTAE